MIARISVKQIKSPWIASCLLAVALAPVAHAVEEFYDPGAHDAQWFSPVDLDFNTRPIRKDNGFFFRYDKLSWAATGERVPIGDPNVQVFSEIIIPDALAQSFSATSGPLTAAVLQYPIFNGLQDVAPTAQFAWGERYEFGRLDGGNGWQVSILDGPEVNSSNTFGNGPEQSGFGSIHVNFATPDNFLLGFRNYWGGGVETSFFVIPTPTLNGPGIVPGNETPADFIDDLDGDGIEGFNFILGDIDGDGEIDDDEVIGIAVDLDDLHEFNVTFNQVNVRNVTETQGVELMRTHQLSNRHKEVKRQRSQWEIAYGVRFLRLRDRFSFDGTSDLLGTAAFTTEAENQIVGPQIRSKWTTQRGRWNLGIDGRFLFGYNITDADQTGSIGLDNTDAFGTVVNPGLVPGGFNRLISGQPTAFSYGRQDNEFSPTAELRANLSYQLTSAVALRLGYTAIFVDNISRASQITRYFLPDMGLRPGGQQEIFINGANFGFEVVH